MQNSGSSRVNVKVVMLGHSAGGKTSLVERFLRGKFEMSYNCTVAAVYRARRVEVNGRSVILGIWDTAGSERFQAISRIYYRDAFAAIVCYDMTDFTSFSKLQYWVNELLLYRPSCRIYFCGTKQDLLGSLPSGSCHVTQSAVQSFAQSIQPQHALHFFETSSKTGFNVQEMFFQIARDYVEAGGSLDGGDEFSVYGVDLIQIEEKSRKCKAC